MTRELQSKIRNEGLDVVWNSKEEILAIMPILTLPNGGFVSNGRVREESEVVL